MTHDDDDLPPESEQPDWEHFWGPDELTGPELLDFLKAIEVDDVWYPEVNPNPSSTLKATEDEDVKVTPEAKGHEDQVIRRAELENDEYESANKHRKIFLWFAVAITGLPIVASSVGFFWMVAANRMTDAVAIAYFTSVVVEVIGLVLVLANYLFPKGGGTPGLANGDAPKPK